MHTPNLDIIKLTYIYENTGYILKFIVKSAVFGTPVSVGTFCTAPLKQWVFWGSRCSLEFGLGFQSDMVKDLDQTNTTGTRSYWWVSMTCSWNIKIKYVYVCVIVGPNSHIPSKHKLTVDQSFSSSEFSPQSHKRTKLSFAAAWLSSVCVCVCVSEGTAPCFLLQISLDPECKKNGSVLFFFLSWNFRTNWNSPSVSCSDCCTS